MWQKLPASHSSVTHLSACAQNDRYTVGGAEMFDTLTDLVEYYKLKGIEEISGNWVYFKQVNVCWRSAFSFHLNRFHKLHKHLWWSSNCVILPNLFPQPYYSTRVNAGDIGSRVKQLDETTEKQQEGEGEKSKAGFWEEFDVRFYLNLSVL